MRHLAAKALSLLLMATSCANARSKNEFDTSVLVDFDGFVGDLDSTEINFVQLELAFRDTYNALSNGLSDAGFPRVLFTNIDKDAGSDGAIIKRGGNTFSLMFKVRAECKKCDNLFAPPSGRSAVRELAVDPDDGNLLPQASKISIQRDLSKGSDSKGSKKGSKSSKGGKGSKSSKSSKKGGSDDWELSAPTEDEFRRNYDSAIRDFATAATPPRRGGVYVDYVTKVTEIEDEELSEVVENFDSLVTLEFFGDRLTVLKSERMELEAAFLQVYNGLLANRCDYPFSRDVTGSSIEMQADPHEPDLFMYVFQVEGTCRGVGCSEDLSFFQDPLSSAASRQLQLSEQTGSSCPVYGVEFGAPSFVDFEVKYFEAIQDLRDRDLIKNLDASGTLTELPFGFTSSPTLTPSETSSMPPTSPPTSTPSEIPSDLPSLAPSVAVSSE